MRGCRPGAACGPRSVDGDAVCGRSATGGPGRPRGALLAPTVPRRLMADLVRRPERAPPSAGILAVLTEGEREVVALVATGLSNDEIAARLFLSPLTAKTHVSRAMTKLSARDRAQLVVLAYESGLVTPGQRAE